MNVSFDTSTGEITIRRQLKRGGVVRDIVKTIYPGQSYLRHSYEDWLMLAAMHEHARNPWNSGEQRKQIEREIAEGWRRLEELTGEPGYPRCLEILGLSPPVTLDKIKAAYREKAKILHPDAGGDAGEFRRVNAAYRVLKRLEGQHEAH
jgi:hypothetical protein